MKKKYIASDLRKIDAMKDTDIDYSDSRELDESFLTRPLVDLPRKELVSIRLDYDIVQWFRGKGRGYQTKINALLRAYIDAQKKATYTKEAGRT